MCILWITFTLPEIGFFPGKPWHAYKCMWCCCCLSRIIYPKPWKWNLRKLQSSFTCLQTLPSASEWTFRPIVATLYQTTGCLSFPRETEQTSYAHLERHILDDLFTGLGRLGKPQICYVGQHAEAQERTAVQVQGLLLTGFPLTQDRSVCDCWGLQLVGLRSFCTPISHSANTIIPNRPSQTELERAQV